MCKDSGVFGKVLHNLKTRNANARVRCVIVSLNAVPLSICFSSCGHKPAKFYTSYFPPRTSYFL